MKTRDIENAATTAAVRTACADGRAKAIRTAARLTLWEVARAVGVAHTTVIRWESGQQLPTGRRALDYARLLARLNGGAL